MSLSKIQVNSNLSNTTRSCPLASTHTCMCTCTYIYVQHIHNTDTREKNITVCSSCLPEVLLLTTTLTSEISLQIWDAPLFFYHTVISQHWYWNLLKPVFQLLLFFEKTYYHMAMNSRSFCLVPSTGIAVLGPGHFNLAFLKAMGLLLYPQFMHT